ncbi:putative antitoxin of bacterial toxin-antitoxin system, YdaS/YdaT [compost metagenome]
MFTRDEMKEAFERAVKAAGGQSELSRKLTASGCRISQQLLWHHLRVKGLCPPELVLKVEEISGVSRYELRPDVFGSRRQVAPHELHPDQPDLFSAPSEVAVEKKAA